MINKNKLGFSEDSKTDKDMTRLIRKKVKAISIGKRNICTCYTDIESIFFK